MIGLVAVTLPPASTSPTRKVLSGSRSEAASLRLALGNAPPGNASRRASMRVPLRPTAAASPAAGERRHSAERNGAGSGAEGNGTSPERLRESSEVAYLSGRSRRVCAHFSTALGVDDFMSRLEIALFAFGFNGDNSIAMVNLCRDEITNTLKHKIESTFGSSFNTNGLGGVLTCGVSGVAAGLSHAPVSQSSGKERYVFFSFPHISIDAKGHVGAISRPGRPGLSCACGALQKALGEIQGDGLASNCKIPGVHDARDPELSILKQRIARRLRFEGAGEATVGRLNLVDLTKVAERTITDDLEYLISQAVDPRKADYAVVTGVQIHNWGEQFDDDSPNLEFVAPTSVYVVVNGEKAHLDLSNMPSLTPRQVRMLAASSERSGGSGALRDDDTLCNEGGHGTLREMDPPYLYSPKDGKRRSRAATYAALIREEGLQPEASCSWPSWQSTLLTGQAHRDEQDTSVVIDANFESDDELDEMWAKLQDKYLMQDTHDVHDVHSVPQPDHAAPQRSSGGGHALGTASQGRASHSPPPGPQVSNSGSPSTLSPPLPSGGHAGSGSTGQPAAAGSEAEAPPKMGLLSRLLRSVRFAKDRRAQRTQQDEGGRH